MTAKTDNVHDIQEIFQAASDRDKRNIRIKPDAIHIIATDAEQALVDYGAPFYQRGGIVKPVIDELPAAHGRKTKAARLTEVEADCMIDYLSRACSWSKFSSRGNKWVPTDPPVAVARTILSRDGEWKFKVLSGVITTPTIRPDGTILLEEGYDEQTQLLLREPPQMPHLPEKPTRDDALRACGLLANLLEEFPFADEVSRSAAMSALITPVVRGAVRTAPMHAVTAPAAGSGKSYIIDIASAIGAGERAPVLAAGKTEEETEKRLGAALLNGQSIISIDNVNGELGGDLLCQMVERPTVSIRPLGSSKLVKIECRATVYSTGNNIHLVGDMTRRVILCSLDPNVERPELRQFEAKPFDMVMADRGKYVAAALTICRAYAVAGYPGELPALASFEDWSRLVRSALVWLGWDDPAKSMDAARADDPTTAGLKSLLAAWHDAIGEDFKTVGQVMERANETGAMGGRTQEHLNHAVAEVAADKYGQSDRRRLASFLSSQKGRVVDGLKLVDQYDKKLKQKIWAVTYV